MKKSQKWIFVCGFVLKLLRNDLVKFDHYLEANFSPSHRRMRDLDLFYFCSDSLQELISHRFHHRNISKHDFEELSVLFVIYLLVISFYLNLAPLRKRYPLE